MSTDSGGEDGLAGTFRLGNEHLAFRFTATVSGRAGRPLERLALPDHLCAWLLANDLDMRGTVTVVHLRVAVRLREAIYRLAVSAADGTPPTSADLDILNSAAAAGSPIPVLRDGRRRWRLDATDAATDALAVIARDAIDVLGNARGRVKVCEGEGCAGVFLDASRGATRRWCAMNTCGNRAKKTRVRNRTSPI